MFALISVFLVLSVTTGGLLVSDRSLPGSPLYPVKRLKEKLELQLAASPQTKAVVYLEHAHKRIDEYVSLVTSVWVEIEAAAKYGTDAESEYQKLQARLELLSSAKALAEAEVYEALFELEAAREELEAQGEIAAEAELRQGMADLKTRAKQAALDIDTGLPLEDEPLVVPDEPMSDLPSTPSRESVVPDWEGDFYTQPTDTSSRIYGGREL